MLKKRQPAIFDKRAFRDAAVTTLSYLYAAKHVVPRHFHEFAQVLYASSGTMTVSAYGSIWVIPPERAVWIPARVEHSIRMHNAVLMKSIYIRPGLATRMPRECAVLNVSPLLRELLIQACTAPRLSLRRKRETHFIALLLDEVEAATHLPLSLLLPRDERALRVALHLIEDPSAGRNMAAVLDIAGAAKRTLERIFLRETGITLGKWRQQLSLVHAVRLLGEGWKVASVAEECGYESPSAFVAMFRTRLGTTPARYSRARL
jgi:AraC-like DNA-binding protein